MSAFAVVPRSEKLAVVRAWWIDAVKYGVASKAIEGAKIAAQVFDVPLNTIRGLQTAAFPDDVKAWTPGADLSKFDASADWRAVAVMQIPERPAPPAPKPAEAAPKSGRTPRKPRAQNPSNAAPKPVAEATPVFPPSTDYAALEACAIVQDEIPKMGRRGRKPGYLDTNPYYVQGGVFYARNEGVAIHTCSRCNSTSAHTHEQLVERFGLRTVRKGFASEKLSFQAYCRKCKSKARTEERHTEILTVDAKIKEFDARVAAGDKNAAIEREDFLLNFADKLEKQRAYSREYQRNLRARLKAEKEARKAAPKTNGDKRR